MLEVITGVDETAGKQKPWLSVTVSSYQRTSAWKYVLSQAASPGAGVYLPHVHLAFATNFV